MAPLFVREGKLPMRIAMTGFSSADVLVVERASSFVLVRTVLNTR